MPDRTGSSRFAASSSDAGAALSLREFAHELNSLLDGSMRTVRTVLDRLRDAAPDDGVSSEHLAERLQSVEAALARMARTLEQAMRGESAEGPPLDLGCSTFGEAGPEVIDLLRPLSDAHRVRVTATVDPAARNISVGRLGPVLVNGLKNAIEASAAAGDERRTVDLHVARDDNTLRITIADSGPGLREMPAPGETTKPAGHGIGLALSRRLVESLGGRLRIVNVPYGDGAILKIDLPLNRLNAPEPQSP